MHRRGRRTPAERESLRTIAGDAKRPPRERGGLQARRAREPDSPQKQARRRERGQARRSRNPQGLRRGTPTRTRRKSPKWGRGESCLIVFPKERTHRAAKNAARRGFCNKQARPRKCAAGVAKSGGRESGARTRRKDDAARHSRERTRSGRPRETGKAGGSESLRRREAQGRELAPPCAPDGENAAPPACTGL